MAQGGPGRTVLNGEALKAAGAVQLSDLFFLLDGWHAMSLEGFAVAAVPSGLSPPNRPSWHLFVDGQWIDLSLFGTQNLNVLPLTIADIDSVEVYTSPTVFGGIDAPAGLLHIHTRPPAPGAAIGGGIAAGNEINDPGPYRYSTLPSPNIDRIGPYWFAGASVAQSRWYVRLGFQASEHHATQPEISRRVYSLYRGVLQPQIRRFAPSLRFGYENYWGRHRGYAGYSLMRDLHFQEPLGEELPLEDNLIHLGLSGTYFQSGLTYRLSVARRDIDPRTNRRSLNPDWQQDRYEANVQVPLGDDTQGGVIGGGGLYLRTFTSYPLSNPDLLFLRLFHRYHLQQGATRLEVGSLWQRIDRKSGVTADASLLFASPDQTHMMGIKLAFRSTPYAALNSPWYWRAQGYRFYDRAALEIDQPLAFESQQRLDLEVQYQYQPLATLTTEVTGLLRRFEGLAVPTYDPVEFKYHFRTTVHPGIEGHVWGATARLSGSLLPSLEQAVQYTFTRPVPGASIVFWEAWASQPVHQVGYTLRFTPNARFGLFLRARYHSATRWPQYHPHGIEPRTRYAQWRPGFIVVDVTARKRLWGERLEATLALRNASNTLYLPHPAGARHDMTLFVQLLASFGP